MLLHLKSGQKVRRRSARVVRSAMSSRTSATTLLQLRRGRERGSVCALRGNYCARQCERALTAGANPHAPAVANGLGIPSLMPITHVPGQHRPRLAGRDYHAIHTGYRR